MNIYHTECPVCHHEFIDGDDVVFCPECGTPHHRDCWDANGHCANAHLHKEHFEWVNPNPEAQPRQEQNPNQNNERKRPSLPFGTVTCPECGCENSANADRCIQCDSRLRQNGQNGFFRSRDALNRNVVPPNVLVDGIPAEEVAAFVGSNSTRYILNFISMERRESKLNFNLGAALFGPLWCFYRKMYKVGLIYLLVAAVITAITLPAGIGEWVTSFTSQMMIGGANIDPEALLEQFYATMPAAAAWQSMLASGFRIASTLIFGLFGDYFYKRKVKTSVLEQRPKASTMPEYMELLKKKGGISILMSLAYLFVFTPLQSFVSFGIAGLLHF